MDSHSFKMLFKAARATLEWARTPGNHGGGNPYALAHVIAAERAIADHENRAPEDWARRPDKAKVIHGGEG